MKLNCTCPRAEAERRHRGPCPRAEAERRHRVLLPILICLLVVTNGCGSPCLTIYVESTPRTNEKRPFYLMVRGVDHKTYVQEAYKEVAATMFHDPQRSVLKTEWIIPGKYQKVQVYLPDGFDKPVAFYFLFTEPGSRWKGFFFQPLPSTVEFDLDGNRIERQY